MRKLSLMLAMFAMAGCKAKVGEKCGKPQDCKFGLTCGPDYVCHDPSNSATDQAPPARTDQTETARKTASPTKGASPVGTPDEPKEPQGAVNVGGRCGKPEDCAVGLQCGDDFKCFDPAVRECETSEGCKKDGLCGFRNGQCAALTASHCTTSKNCKIKGLCNTLHGQCSAGSKAECERSTDCLEIGRCTPGEGVCAVGSTADCRRSRRCEQNGQCTLIAKRCAAAGSDDCSVHSKVCEKDGRCDAIDGACVLANPDPGLEP